MIKGRPPKAVGEPIAPFQQGDWVLSFQGHIGSVVTSNSMMTTTYFYGLYPDDPKRVYAHAALNTGLTKIPEDVAENLLLLKGVEL